MLNDFTEPCSAHISKSKVRLSFITLYVCVCVSGVRPRKMRKKDDEREITAKKRKIYVAGKRTGLRETERESKEKGERIQRGRVN